MNFEKQEIYQNNPVLLYTQQVFLFHKIKIGPQWEQVSSAGWILGIDSLHTDFVMS